MTFMVFHHLHYRRLAAGLESMRAGHDHELQSCRGRPRGSQWMLQKGFAAKSYCILIDWLYTLW